MRGEENREKTEHRGHRGRSTESTERRKMPDLAAGIAAVPRKRDAVRRYKIRVTKVRGGKKLPDTRCVVMSRGNIDDPSCICFRPLVIPAKDSARSTSGRMPLKALMSFYMAPWALR